MGQLSIEHTLGFASARAGIGKTTLVVELAAWFAARGHSVALLDADLGAPDALGLLREAPRGLASFSLGRALDERGLTSLGGELLERELARLLEEELDFGRRELLLVDLAPGAEANEAWLEALGLDALVLVAREGEDFACESSVPILGRIETFAHAAGPARGAALLGRIPFDPRLRELGQRGMLLALEETHAIAQAGAKLWKRVQSRLS